jgi:hypothetical protein
MLPGPPSVLTQVLSDLFARLFVQLSGYLQVLQFRLHQALTLSKQFRQILVRHKVTEQSCRQAKVYMSLRMVE